LVDTICYQMSTRPQLNLTPPQGLIKRLEELAGLYKNDVARKNEIAVEVLQLYLPFWEAAEAAKAEIISKQRRDAVLSVLQGGEVDVIARHAETNAPTARLIGQVDEVGPMEPATERQVTSAPNHLPKPTQRRRKKGAKKVS
jgi:hypothetical protein